MSNRTVQLKDASNNNCYPELITEDISSQYTITTTIGSVAVFKAFRCGNTIEMTIGGENTSNVAVGSDFVKGTISGGPLPSNAARLMGFKEQAILFCNLNSAGAFNARVLCAQRNAGGTSNMAGTFVCSE